ncbi:nucleotidyltransferase domain-containing protein [Mastigocoleus testarum]|uniref:Nucleotidyltransferase n=1 Tax=Mastigocoleus testarum BC008 TaxID=371196 RepID=A0A0V7ZTH4_9CYAN|nr:nucleotidyltransferase family protein [Mastigocoleus testarum]KST67758.1 hypothetical protein BC008_44235 [Mastigocoleus testarum BC008]
MQLLADSDLEKQKINLSRDISPEIELLLYALYPEVEDRTLEEIKVLAQKPIDWKFFLKTAYRHGVAPLLYSRINNNCPEYIPEPVLRELRSIFHANAQNNLFITGELIKILSLLQKQNITVFPYKGPVLANSIYGNVGMRRFCDLDIMVQPKDIFAVKELLISLGYQPKRKMNRAQELAYLRSRNQHTYDFIDEPKKILIEVHWRLGPKVFTDIKPDDFWNNLTPINISNITTLTLPPEYYLPILCVHGSRHIWTKLAWLCDIATLIYTNPNLNWERVIHNSEKWQCKRILFVGLLLTINLFEVNLPPEIYQQIKSDKIIEKIIPLVYAQLFDKVRTSEKFLGKTLYHVQTRERLQDKLLYLQSFIHWFKTTSMGLSI